MNNTAVTAQSKTKPWRSALNDALVVLPAITLGVVAMIAGGVSPVLWIQQAAAFVIFALLGMLGSFFRKVPAFVWTAVLLAALVATLFFPAVGGARRWLDLGVLNVHAALLALPPLLFLLDRKKCPWPVMLIAAAVLCLQPDFSQLAAFSLSILPILWKQRKRAVWAIGSLVVLAILIIRCSSLPVRLESVPYCEGILGMLGEISPVLLAAGGLAMALIPGCFLYQFIKNSSRTALCLAVYYAAAILFSLSGQYPVLFMGFGLSPIAGYWFVSSLQLSADPTA